MTGDRTGGSVGFLLAMGLAAIAALHFVLVTSVGVRGLVNANGNVVGEDFAQIWLGGRLAIEGRIHEIFSPELFRAAARAAFEAPNVPAIFSYPPTTLLPAVALALLPYPVALGLWSALQAGLFTTALLLATRGFLSTPVAVFVALASPSLALTLPWGQFGSIVAALMTLGILLVDRRQLLSGVLLGLIAVKPQFGVLVPVALLAGRHWRAFLAAGASMTALVVLSLLLVGLRGWEDFVSIALPAQIAITSDPANYVPIAHSIRDRLILMGVEPPAARAAQIATAMLALVAVAYAFWRDLAPAHRLFVLAAATMAALPYVAVYDQAIVAIAALALVAHARQDALTLGILVFLWASPIVDLWLTMGAQPQIGPFIGPIAVAVVLANARRISLSYSG